MAFLASGVVFPIVASLAGFYMGTFFVSDHVTDLQPKDIPNGVIGAGIGFVIAILTFLFVAATYPKVIEREYAEREECERAHATY